NAEANVEENEQALMESLGLVKSGQVTYAVRDTVMNDIDVKEGNIIGIAEGKLLSAGEGVDEITTNLVEKLVDEDTAIVTLFYGEDVSEESANELRDLLEEKFEDIDIELYYGGQPLYYYLISVE
ncbi:MAG: DAK2 domain-containing protein, partial [Romboutsia sp.]|nr:DAK2 domain-containing protein [Romboutsia sp.]